MQKGVVSLIYNITKNSVVEEFDTSILESKDITAGYLTLEEFEKIHVQLGITADSIGEYKNAKDSIRTTVEVYNEYISGILTIIEPTSIHEKFDKIGFLIKKNLFLIIKIKDEDDSTKEMFASSLRKYTENVTLEKLIFGFFEQLISGDGIVLEGIGRRITALEENMLNHEPDKYVNNEIFAFKKELLVYKDYYEQLIDIGEELQENDIFQKRDLRYFKIFTNKVGRLRDNVVSLTEMTVHLREAYEATLDINLNQIMKVFTVVTTIFMPLTLIAGWYGMNFNSMPEITWKYGYISTISLSVLVVIFCIIFFKKKKFM